MNCNPVDCPPKTSLDYFLLLMLHRLLAVQCRSRSLVPASILPTSLAVRVSLSSPFHLYFWADRLNWKGGVSLGLPRSLPVPPLVVGFEGLRFGWVGIVTMSSMSSS